jgi:signal transduction histidine kinase
LLVNAGFLLFLGGVELAFAKVKLIFFVSAIPVRRACLLCSEGGDGDMVTLHFQVADTGCGIPQSRLAEIFLVGASCSISCWFPGSHFSPLVCVSSQPFTQADQSVGRKYAGSGLGLTIAQAFANQMGGQVTVKSIGTRSMLQDASASRLTRRFACCGLLRSCS